MQVEIDLSDVFLHDSKHDSDALGWAEFMGRKDIVEIIKARVRRE